MCFRKPSTRVFRLDDFEQSGLFKRVKTQTNVLEAWEHELLQLKAEGRYMEFMRRAVQQHQTIMCAGKTGSGKTTFMKALIEEIPNAERLITIEDASEVKLPSHRNKAHLFYSKNGQGASDVSAKTLLEATNRMRPDRVFLAEMRGEEAFYFLRLAASGHPGSITSLHAGSCEQAFDQISLMVRESAGGGGMTMPEIQQLTRSIIDVVVHFNVDGAGRYISGIYYDLKHACRRRNECRDQAIHNSPEVGHRRWGVPLPGGGDLGHALRQRGHLYAAAQEAARRD